MLLAKTLLILELLGLLLKEIVALSSLRELAVDELVFSSQSLDILCELMHFSCFHVYNLNLVVNLLSEVLIFLSE